MGIESSYLDFSSSQVQYETGSRVQEIIHYPLFIIHYPLSIIHYPLSIIHYPLSIIHYPLSIIHYPQQMKKSPLRNTILTVIFCIIAFQPAYATHIIGGEMNYKCLGNNQYQISLTVYRDCFLGEALLDDTAFVAVYDMEGVLVTTLPIELGKIDTILQIDQCLVIPPNICVSTTTYVDTIELLPRSGSYHIAYQRCCRNATILNILDPLNTGATYDIILTEVAMQSCNSSPIIRDWPPTFICVNRPIQYNHSAVDFEGDSLVYSLCTPFVGGITIDLPRPKPAFPPPYENIIWNEPTYNLDNVLGGIPLKIDSKTGVLSGTPNIIGQFVVGVCVEEYRNGQLLSTTRRDFQYNVIPCEDVTAQFDSPASQCENLSVSFENQTGGEPDGFLWKFMDKNLTIIGTSREVNSSYTFPDTGTYMIRLIVNPNGVCVDSIDHPIFLQNNSIVADFQYDILNCTDSLVLQFTDKSIDSIGIINNWIWTFTGEIDQFIITEQHPKVTILNSQQLVVKLEVSSENGCTDEHIIDLMAIIIPDSFSISTFDTLIVCQGDSIELNPIYNPDLTYFWSPPHGLSDVNSPNPKAFPDTSTAYLLMIRDSANNCEIRRNVFLEVINFDTTFDFTINVLECGDSLNLQINVDPNFDFTDKFLEWEIINAGNTSVFTNTHPQITIFNSEEVFIQGTLTDIFGCSTTKEKSIQIDLVSVEIEEQLSVCRGDSIALNPNFNPNYSYRWLPESAFVDPTQPNPIIVPQSTGTFSVEINNSTGNCPIQKSIILTVLNSIESLDFQFKVANCTDSILLEITDVFTEPAGLINEILWELDGDLESRATSQLLPIFILNNSQNINLKLAINPSSSCPETITKSFKTNLLNDISLPDSLVICNGESVALNPNGSFPEYVYQWTPSTNLSDANSNNPLANPSETTTYQLSYTDNTGLCQIEKEIKVVVLEKLEKISADFEVNCDGLSVIFTPTQSVPISWDFGDGTPLFQSNFDISIPHIYENSGDFEVTLQYASERVCPDSTNLLISLPENNISPDFEWQVESCEDNIASLKLIDLTSTVFGEISAWNWQLNNGMNAAEKEPIFSINKGETTIAILIITVDNNANCTDSISMEVPQLIIAETIPDSLFTCFGNTLELNPEFDNSYTYSWTPSEGLNDPTAANPSVTVETSNQFIASISNEFSCILFDTVLTNVAPEIIINSLEVPALCEEMEIVITAESEQTEQQLWLNENGDTLGLEPELLVNINRPRTFTAAFTDEFGCTNSSTLFVDYQPIMLYYEKEILACSTGNSSILVENLRPENDLKYDWQPAINIVEGANSNQPIIQTEGPTTFTFIASNEFGCQFTDDIFVDIKELPELDVTAMPDTIFDGAPVQLIATPNPNYSYEWSPANTLNDPLISNPLAMPMETTTYTVTVTDETGCTNTASSNIFVRPAVCGPPFIFVPTAFTPNGDGENDVLYVRGNFISTMTFTIYDRWGDKVFETNNKDIGWDGTRNGKELSSGVFGYYLRAVCGNGEVYFKRGNVTLIR